MMTSKRLVAVVGVLLVAMALAGTTWAAVGDGGHDRWPTGVMGGFGDRGFAMTGPGSHPGYGGMMDGGRGGMMDGGAYGIAGTGPVSTIDAARDAARRYADTLDLEVGEVMEFSENFYAELQAPSGELATEVLIDPDTGSVRLEYGPAMMWNTSYGMHMAAPSGGAAVSADRAQQIADEWLARHQDGSTAGEPDVFPGYYTLHVLKDGGVTGMLSVNATTGSVWYHSWHGAFVSMSE